jgi:hypothetical protein
VGMKMANCIEHSSDIKHCCVVIKAAITRKSCKKFPSLDVLKHHIDVLRVLKGGFSGWEMKYNATMLG